MARVSKTDWFNEGVLLLVERGAEGLTIDALLGRLNVTKGSFYHHFKNVDDFIQGLLNYIEQEGTLHIIEQVEQANNTPQERLRRLLDIVLTYSPELEVSIRAWSHLNKAARQVQQRVDTRRVEFLTEILCEMGYEADQALRIARILYAILIGSEHMHPPVQGQDLAALFDEFLKPYGL